MERGDGGVYGEAPRRNNKKIFYLRDRSCRLRCSLLLKARLQYWHLYFFSGAEVAFFGVAVAALAFAGSEAVEVSAWAMVQKMKG